MAVAVPSRARLARIARGRPWIDLLVVAWLWWGFDAVNNLGGEVRQQSSERHGRALLDLERALHVAPEHALNAALAGHHALRAIVANFYDNVHGLVTLGVLGLLWWLRSPELPRLRLAIVAANLVALAVFWTWPVAPPRMLAGQGFVDLVGVVRDGAGWQTGATAAYPNQLSALPSLHIAWALWSAIAVWRLTSRRWVRAVAVAYLPVTVYAVMATANHYLADAVLGAALMALAVLAADRVLRARRACC